MDNITTKTTETRKSEMLSQTPKERKYKRKVSYFLEL